MEEYPGYTKNCNTCPVEQVSWDNVQLFIQKLNKLTGKKYRLPSEKEWEFAARGGTKSQNYKYSGSNNIDSVSWCKLTGNSLQPVGKKQPNEIGLYDMSGNVFEWCSSFFTETLEIYLKFPEGVTNGVERVIKGGSWRQSEFHSQVMRRSKAYPDEASADIGFRLASDQ